MKNISRYVRPASRMASQGLRALCVVVLMLVTSISNGQNSQAATPTSSIDVVTHRLLERQPVLAPGQSAAQLADGRWLLAGGDLQPSKLTYVDTATGVRSASSASLIQPRSGHTTTLLADGTVFIFGGTGVDGAVLDTAEIFDPAVDAINTLGAVGLLPRTKHSATALSNGQVLVVGGIGLDKEPLLDAELYSARSRRAERFDFRLDSARIAQLAALLPDRSVLLWKGMDSKGKPIDAGELYDPDTKQMAPVGNQAADALTKPLNAPEAPAMRSSNPVSGAVGVPVDSALTVQFSKRMAVVSLNASTVTLLGPNGPTSIKPVAVERGVSLFVTPSRDLLPDSHYTLFIQGATDEQGRPLPFTAIGFKTVAFKAADDASHSGASSGGESSPAGGNQAGNGLMSGGLLGSGAVGRGPITIPPSGLRDIRSIIGSVLDAYGLTAGGNIDANIPLDDTELWLPGASQRRGTWVSGRRHLAMEHLPANGHLNRALYGDPDVIAAAAKATPATIAAGALRQLTAKVAAKVVGGPTSLAGQVLRLNGRPLSNVSLSIGDVETRTDLNGEFSLSGIPSGHQVLVIDGGSTNGGRPEYGRYEYGIEIRRGQPNVLPFVIWMSRLDSRNALDISSPTIGLTVLTNPRIPGLELRIPAGTVIRDAKGKIVTRLSMTAIPVDQAPFPLPNFPVPTYFTVQPGGAHLEAIDGGPSQGAQLVYPNFTKSSPGTRMTFWDYDARVKGWYAYGEGTVTADGTQIMPDPGVRVYAFSGAMVSLPSNAPAEGPPDGGCKAGDPVDCYTGLFLNEKVDLAIPDTIPLEVRRSYRNRDTASRAFGIGTNLSYDFFLVGDTSPWTYQDLILPDGGRIHYARISPGTSFADAVYQNTSSPGRYYGSIIKHGVTSETYWTLTLRDGTTYGFVDAFASSSARNAAVRTIADRYGNKLVLTRDNSKNLTQIMSPNGRKLVLVYDSGNRVTQVTDDLGRILQYAYDASGRLITATDPAGKSEHFTYDSNHNMLSVTDKRGNVMVTNTYDANGRVSTQTYADSTTSSFAYTLNGAGTAVVQTDFTDQRGVVRRMIFGAKGYPTSVTKALGRGEQQVVSFDRDATTTLLNSMTDALNRTTTYTYDVLGNNTTITRADGSSVSYSYEPTFSQLQSTIDPNNNVTQITLDGLGNPVQITDPLNHSSQVVFDVQGRPITVTDPLNHTTTIDYFGGDPNRVVDALGRANVRVTDVVGRAVSLMDPNHNATAYTYDALDRVTSVADPNGGVIQFSYDENGNVLTQTDARNNVTTFTYDSLNRVLSKTDQLGHVESYTYDAIGNLATKTDRKGQTSSYTYDGLNRLTAINYGDSNVAYTLDAGDRVTQIVDSANGTIGKSYDALDRLTQETSSQGTVTWTYDAGGRRSSMTVSGQPAVSYGYDAASRLIQVQQAAGTINGNQVQTVTIGYDAANRRNQLVLPNGVKASYAYDAASQLSGIIYAKSDDTIIGDLSYSYDSTGRRTTVAGSLANVDFPAALSGTPSYNANNQLTLWNGVSYTYDLNGSLLSDGSATYAWNSRNQLASIGGSTAASFQYDAVGRRRQTTISGTTTTFLYDGDNFVQKVIGSSTFSQLTGGLDEIFAQYSGTGVNVPLTDALGSSLGETNGSQQVTTDYSYEPYGATSRNGADTGNTQQYTGRENDLSGLYYYRARYYNPATGRFTSEDPIGWASGQPNDYAYVGGDPINLIDPMGLAEEHTKGARPSTKGKHEKGAARKQMDSGNEKGDDRRDWPRKRPPDHKGPWPPRGGPLTGPVLMMPIDPCLLILGGCEELPQPPEDC